MALVRSLLTLAAAALIAAPLAAQGLGTVTGRVVDAATQQPVAAAAVAVGTTGRGGTTGSDGRFTITAVPAGTHALRVSRVGFAEASQPVTVAAGQTVTANVQLASQVVQLEQLVAVGYGTQRREAVTGSVATVDVEEANVGVVTNANEMIQGRVAGVNITMNNGEPGAGAQIRIRGGTSISASNEPLYVIDGVPIENAPTEPGGIGIGGSASQPRSPLTLINPSDIASITILKDASSTAIYGSRGANGVVLIQTKQGSAGRVSVEYDGYVAMASPANYLEVLNGEQYRAFIQQQVSLGNLAADRLTGLGSDNTDWERAVTRNALTQNHNLSFSGGSVATRYRASLNYMDQEGVVLDNGFRRLQGRLNGTHSTFDDRLRLGLNLNASHVINDYLPYENTGGFEGGVFTNMVIFNPTRPVSVVDQASGADRFYEAGIGRQSVRNPVALAEQIDDEGETTRTLGNVTADLDLLPGLTGQMNFGVDRSEGTRRTYFPLSSPVGAEWQGRARQVSRENTSMTLQTLLTLRQSFAEVHDLDIVGGYEWSNYDIAEFGAEARGFVTDAFSFNNLGGGNQLIQPFSFRNESRLASFFTRANYSIADRYYLTGVLRYDGSSRFGEGNKWALFPAVSASWRISEEGFLQNGPFSDLRVRAGYGLQGNPAVPPYASLILLETTSGSRYAFGEQITTGVAPVRNPNPDLKWEETAQFNLGLDYGFLDNRVTGALEYYVKNTRDLLLEVSVPQPALVATRLENIGKVRNRGVEFNLDALVLERDNLSWRAALVGAVERNEVVDLGGRTFITTGDVSGQGQSGQRSQRIMPGHAIGTFFGPVFTGVDDQGRQLFKKYTVQRDDAGREVGREESGTTTNPGGDDYVVIGDANPDYTVSLRSNVDWGRLDFSFLLAGSFGQEVFNNAALVYSTKGNALQDKNFLASALNDPTGIREPAIFSSRWIEDGTFVRLRNVTLGYRFQPPGFGDQVQDARVYLSADNLFLLTDYTGYDPEVHTDAGLASRGIDYLSYPRPRTLTAGINFTF